MGLQAWGMVFLARYQRKRKRRTKGKRKTVKFWGSPQVTLKPSTAVPPSQPHPAIRELDGDGEGTPRLRGALEAQTTVAPTPALFGASYLSQTGPDAAPPPAGPSTKPPWGDAGSRAHQDPSKDGKKYQIWADFWGNHEWHRRGWEDVTLLAGLSPQASAQPVPAAGAEHQGLQRSAQRNSRHRRQSGAVDTSVSPDTITCQQLLVHLKFIPNGEHLLVTCSLSAQGSVLAASPRVSAHHLCCTPPDGYTLGVQGCPSFHHAAPPDPFLPQQSIAFSVLNFTTYEMP